jgi:SNF2 family DNA or RNA helicase
MHMAAFVSLEDISDALPPYQEQVLSVEMDPALRQAYADIENDIREAIRQNPGNASVISTALNTLLLYPDHPYGLGTLYGFRRDEETGAHEKFAITTPPDLDEHFTYAKERRLLQEVRTELARGRKVQVFAVYTRKRDVTRRLKELLLREGIRAEVLTADVPPEQREAWYERQLRNGMQVSIAHPKLVMTGLDILECPTILWYETGYSTYVLRQASRRSWRIGQRHPVRVGFLAYAGTAQEQCLRLMGKKLLVALAIEGKLQVDGLQAMDEDDDVLTAMARELVTRQCVGEEAAAVWRSLQTNREEHMRPSIPLIPSQDDREADPADDSRLQLPPAPSAVQLDLF